MVFLLVFHNDPERPPHAFLLQRVSDRVLVTNLQVSHRSPPPSYSDGRERRMLSRRLTSPCPASACTPAWGPPGQSFYGLRLPHRVLSQVAQTECLVGEVPHANGHDPNQSFLCRPVRLYQIGAVESDYHAESFCPEIQALSQCAPLGVLHLASTDTPAGPRVR